MSEVRASQLAHWKSNEAFKDGVIGHKHIRTYVHTYVCTYVRRHICTYVYTHIRIYAQQSTVQKRDTTNTVLQERVTQKVLYNACGLASAPIRIYVPVHSHYCAIAKDPTYPLRLCNNT